MMCRRCGADIPPTGRRGRPRLYCSDSCREQAKHDRAWERWLAKQTPSDAQVFRDLLSSS